MFRIKLSLSQSIDEGKNAEIKAQQTRDVQFDPLFSIPSAVDGSDTYSCHHSGRNVRIIILDY